MNRIGSGLKFFTSELVLGSLVAILSVLAAVSGYQSSMADSDQTKNNVLGQQMLTDANAEYLTANQMIVYDYTMYDGWYMTDDADKEEYYQLSFSPELQASIAANESDPFSDAYYEAMHAAPQAMFDEADRFYEVAEQWNERGDALQLVLLVSALALAFAAWASLLGAESRVRLFFAVFSIIGLVYSLMLYVAVPVVAG
ncbi:MAG: hypothetical protein JNL73_22020 [Anaerolineales bacterium]|nr:hypothetical protein [Anaerolineales bacterium]